MQAVFQVLAFLCSLLCLQPGEFTRTKLHFLAVVWWCDGSVKKTSQAALEWWVRILFPKSAIKFEAPLSSVKTSHSASASLFGLCNPGLFWVSWTSNRPMTYSLTSLMGPSCWDSATLKLVASPLLGSLTLVSSSLFKTYLGSNKLLLLQNYFNKWLLSIRDSWWWGQLRKRAQRCRRDTVAAAEAALVESSHGKHSY